MLGFIICTLLEILLGWPTQGR